MWDSLLQSISTSGITNAITITENNVIISGHQRVRALKELGVTQVNAEIKIYESEDEILADLIETNIRQRGIGNPNAMKLSRCIKEIERIYGVRNGSSNEKGNNRIGEPKVSADQSDVANMFGLSVDTLNNYKKLTEMIPELEELVDTGIATPTTALAIMRNLLENVPLSMGCQRHWIVVEGLGHLLDREYNYYIYGTFVIPLDSNMA